MRKKKIASILSALTAMTIAAPVFSQNDLNYIFGGDSLGLVHNASIAVYDDVSGGCWTNAEAIKQKARLTLEQSGISVYLEPLSTRYPAAAAIYIEAFGERAADSTCYGSIEVGVSDTASRMIGDTHLMGEINYFRETSAAIGYTLNEQFSRAVEENINKLAAEILSTRRNEKVESIIGEYGESLAAKPETRAELHKRLGIAPPE